VITERENYLRAVEFRYPEWIPCRVYISYAAWKRHQIHFHHLWNSPDTYLLKDVHMPFTISELLLQSYGEAIRLFPAWPREKSARFDTFRAEGGFLVSSSLNNGNIGSTKIHSTMGRIYRLQ